MRLTRHARNRLRRIRRCHPEVTSEEILNGLIRGSTLGYDRLGNRLVRITVGGLFVTVVVTGDRRVVITIWVS